MGRTRLGVTLGLTMVLHTWTRKLTDHVHLHVMVTAGDLALDVETFNEVEEKFLLQVKPLASLSKGKLMDGLRDLRKAGEIAMSDGAFESLMATPWDLDWPVYLIEAFRDGQNQRHLPFWKFGGLATHRRRNGSPGPRIALKARSRRPRAGKLNGFFIFGKDISSWQDCWRFEGRNCRCHPAPGWPFQALFSLDLLDRRIESQVVV